MATVLTAQVSHQSVEVSFNAMGDEVKGDTVYDCSPAAIATAIKFLKDNSITCDVKNDKNLTGLKAALDKKQKHSRLPTAQQAAEAMEKMQ